MYIKASQALSNLTASFSRHSSIYSSSLLSYFYSADSDSSDTSELIYHEASSSRNGTPSPQPPPPLPKRNSNQSNQLSVTYPDGKDQTPLLRIAMPTPTPESRRTSLGEVTHELHQRRGRATPQSEVESLILESKQYVDDIRARRDNIHATLLRGTAPGDRLRRMLGIRLETQLVKVSQGLRKSRTLTRKRAKKKPARLKTKPRVFADNQHKVSFFRKVAKKLPWTRPRLQNYILGDTSMADEDFPSDIDQLSNHSSPRFIVDRQGTFRWPPITVAIGEAEAPPAVALGTTDNFTLARPPKNTSPEDGPSVLGWLQVNTDSHVFTPALASPGGREGPFKKAPFHSNMHVLKTKI